MLIHDLAFALQEENTGRLMDCLKWIGNSYPEYPILSQFCVELINALNASELVTPPDTFKDRNEEKFQDYVKAWMHLLTTDTPTGTESIPHVEDVYLATAAASVLTIYKFQTQEKSRRKPISLASFGRAEIALRKVLLAEHKLLDEFRSRTSDLWQFLSTLRTLESNGTFSKKITENRIKPLRLIFEYALGEREGKHEHTKSILPEILSIPVEDDSDNVDEATRVIRTRTGEDGNLNHIPAKENTYDGPASKSYVEPPRAEKAKPTAVSPHLQHRTNHKISQRLVMAQVLSGASHKALSDKDVALLRKECFELLSTEDLQGSPTWENALFLMLTLITGRSIRFLRNLQFKFQTAKGFPGEPCWIWRDLQCYLYDVPDIPRNRCPDMVGELDASDLFSQEKSAGFFIQVPDEVAEKLVRHKNSSIPRKNRLAETESQTLAAFGSLRDRNVSLTKVQVTCA